MSDANTTTQAAQTVTPAASAANAAQQQAAPAEGQDPHWLAGRLERERGKLLAELGVEKAEDAKTALSAWKVAQEANKTELQKAQERASKLDATEAQLVAHKAALTSYATEELGKLTEPQRAAVKAAAGDDPARQLTMLTALRPTWASGATTTAAGAQTGARTMPTPANTSSTTVAGAAPPPAVAAPTANHLAVYDQLQAANPIAAADYYTQHGPEIRAARNARAG